MREILFRGKRIGSGEWVEGGAYRGKFTWIITTDAPGHFKQYMVDKTTVGQYTGLTDKNGKRIFEGDVVRISKTLFAVEWRGAEFVFGHIAGQPWSYPYFASHAESCEVIGNIHDNPELLKEEPT